MDKHTELASKIMMAVYDLLDKNSENFVKLTDADLPAFFHGFTMAGAFFYEQITGEGKNYLEFNQLQNTLCFQFMTQD